MIPIQKQESQNVLTKIEDLESLNQEAEALTKNPKWGKGTESLDFKKAMLDLSIALSKAIIVLRAEALGIRLDSQLLETGGIK